MEKEQFDQILKKYNAGTATQEEIAFLEAYYKAFGLRPDFNETSESDPLWSDMKTTIDSRIDEHLLGQAPDRSRKLRLWSRIAAAASIVLLLSFGLFYYNQKKSIENQNQIVQHNIKPGGNKAFLTLSNGERISLTDATNGNIAQQAGVTITKTADGQISYVISSEHSDEKSVEEGYNTIETPSGGQYQVRLPDGTAVWLNAASSLKYSASFASKKERHVQLSGEAYFEVAKDKTRPFLVTSNGQEVEVLGTHFNINAYDDEANTKTTLLEGSVKVGLADQNTRILKPGEQAVNSAGSMVIEKVNTEYAVAWKNGFFRFNDKTLDAAMREVARWYNVEVIYKRPALKNELLAGRISKYANIAQVLKKMELADVLQFKIEGRKIIVE